MKKGHFLCECLRITALNRTLVTGWPTCETKVSVRIWLSRDGGREELLMRNPTRSEDKSEQPLLFFCPFIYIS